MTAHHSLPNSLNVHRCLRSCKTAQSPRDVLNVFMTSHSKVFCVCVGELKGLTVRLLLTGGMVDLSIIASAPIKVVFLVHFILTSWAAGHWCPVSYLFYNLLFFLILLWAVHSKEGDEPTQMAVAVNTISIVLDVMVIAMYFPNAKSGSDRFSAAMAILNLILRPLTTLILYRIYVERANATGATVPTIFGVGTQQRAPYEDIGGAVHQSVPTNVPSPSNKVPPPYHA